MAEGIVKVQSSDGDVIDVAADIAKQWGPIRALYESNGVIQARLTKHCSCSLSLRSFS